MIDYVIWVAYFISNSVMCSWSFFHLSETFLISVSHVYVTVADRCHFIHDRPEHCIVGYMQQFSFGFWKYGCEFLFDSYFTWILKFILCVLCPKMCICTDNVANQEVFQISLPQFVWEAKYETLYTHLLEKEYNVKYCVRYIFSIIHFFSNVTFPMWPFCPCFSS